MRWLSVLNVVVIYGALFLSEARTGMAASLIGVIAAAITWAFSSQHAAVLAGRGRVIAMAGVVVLLFAAAVASRALDGSLGDFCVHHSAVPGCIGWVFW